MITLLLGPTSTFPFHGVTRFIKGEPIAIKFDIKLLTQLFLDDISADKYNIDFDLWQRERKNGVVLTTPEIMKYMQQEFEHYWSLELAEAQKNGNLHLYNDNIFNQKQRRKLSHKLCSYVNNVSMYVWDYAMSTDLFHGFDTHIIYVIVWIMLFSHCVLKNKFTDTIDIFKSMSLP